MGGEHNYKYNYEDIYNEWLKGKTHKELVELFECASDTVTSALESFNVPNELIRFRSNANINEIQLKESWDSGLSLRQIYLKYGLKSSTAKKILILLGVPEKEILDRGIYNRNNSSSTKIGQYDLNNNLINIFNSIKEANIYLGVSSTSNQISRVLSDKYPQRKIAYGYKWRKIYEI